MAGDTHLRFLRLGEPSAVQLKFERTIRDPLQGDIGLTREECSIIDHPAFQRLRRVRQLGMTYLVYPGAVHTRFEHSLGTLAEAHRIIEAVNSNPVVADKDPARRWRLTDAGVKLARLCALLHDVSHIPFGHTLEHELSLMKDHDSRDVMEAAVEPFRETIDRYGGDCFNTDSLLNCLEAKEHKDNHDGGRSFDPEERAIGEIVGDTISADLRDYLKRDFYYTGLAADMDDRLLKYFYISKLPHREEYHLTIELDKGGAIRRDNITEILHLLRLRYFLGERVYYHQTKIIASAMIARAVQEHYGGDRAELCQDLRQLGDDELIRRLANEGKTQVARKLAGAVLQRRLYKTIWAWFGAGDVQHIVGNYFWSPEHRVKWENGLAERVGGEPGQVLIYCPKFGMSFKPARVYVHLKNPAELGEDSVVAQLERVAAQRIVDELEAIENLRKDHENLWCCYVMVDPELVKQAAASGRYREFEDFKRSLFGHEVPPFGILGKLPKYKTDRLSRLFDDALMGVRRGDPA